MLLNPVFVNEISGIPLQDWDNSSLKEQLKVYLINVVAVVKKIWDNFVNHEYINQEAQRPPKWSNTVGWEDSWSSFVRCRAKSFGTMASIDAANYEDAKHPELISGLLSKDITGKYICEDNPYSYNISYKIVII